MNIPNIASIDTNKLLKAQVLRAKVKYLQAQTGGKISAQLSRTTKEVIFTVYSRVLECQSGGKLPR